MSKTCLLCSSRIWFAFEYINSKTIWTHSLGFHSANLKQNFLNPIGRQCFDFVRPKSWSVRPNWCTRSNFVRPESLSLCPRTQGRALDTSLVIPSVAINYALFYSLLWHKSIIMGTTIPLYMYVIICCRQTHVHTWELHKVWLFEDNLSGFNLLNQNVGMVRCLSPVGRFPSVRANNILKLKYFWNSFINCWQDHRKKCKCFIEISQ